MNRGEQRIAVVGGGLSGLVVAEALQRKGYGQVTVFEQEERLGGKLYSICYRGRSYELGAIFGLPSQLSLKGLMKRLQIKADGPKLSRLNYNAKGEKIMPLPKEDLGALLEELKHLPEVVNQYPVLERAAADGIESELMLPFSQWCDLHGFHILKTVYVHYFTIFGLGNLEEVPAFYVLKILNYQHLMSFIELPEFSTWREGVSIFARKLKEQLRDIRLGQRVMDITFQEEGSLLVKTPYEAIPFDRVVLTAPLDQFSHLSCWEEPVREHLRSIKYQAFNVYAFVAENIPKGCGCILENLSTDRWGHITIWDARWEQREQEGMIILYAYDPPPSVKTPALEIIKEDLLQLGVKNPRLYQKKAWRHCPFVDTEQLRRGFYETLEGIQGKYNIYLAGEIMSTLSMDNTIRYAQDLVKRFF